MRRVRPGFAVASACLVAFLAATLVTAQPRVHRIGVVLLGGPYARAIDGLRDGLHELGLEEGKQYALLVRDARGDLKAAGAAAKALEAEGVDVIFAVGSTVAVTTMRATKSVSIVFHSGADPVTLGLVENFRKPGGRLTGVSSQSRDLGPKRLELLKEMVPTARRVVMFTTGHAPSYGCYRIGITAATAARTRRAVPGLREGLRELRLRAQTAKAIGVTIPKSVVARADEVIQ